MVRPDRRQGRRKERKQELRQVGRKASRQEGRKGRLKDTRRKEWIRWSNVRLFPTKQRIHEEKCRMFVG